jgi:transposase-like protein
LLAHLDGLTPGQGKALLRAVQGIGRPTQVVATIESARAALLACPRCQSRAHRRHGHANGLQRFRCRACGRTFNSLSGTPMARLRHNEDSAIQL